MLSLILIYLFSVAIIQTFFLEERIETTWLRRTVLIYQVPAAFLYCASVELVLLMFHRNLSEFIRAVTEDFPAMVWREW